MIENSDFHMVLPSNASPNMHPNNTATDFTVSLQNPIKLDPKKSWKVALMDMCYSHERLEDCGISYRFYTNQRHAYQFQILISYPDYKVGPRFLQLGNAETGIITIETSIWKDQVYFWSKTIPFQLKTLRGAEVKCEWEDFWQQYYCFDPNYVTNYFPIKNKVHDTAMLNYSIIAYFGSEREYVSIPKHIITRTPNEIVQYMIEWGREIFHNLRLDGNVVKFGLAKRVFYVKFVGGFSQLLGFNKDEFQPDADERLKLSSIYSNYERAVSSSFEGKPIPQIHYTDKNLHIYCNMCKNVDVGNTKIPLLKSVSIDTSPATGVHGYVRNIIFAYPTYVEVRNKIISKIHIDIRDSVGKKVKFQSGSITVMTLQFKCD